MIESIIKIKVIMTVCKMSIFHHEDIFSLELSKEMSSNLIKNIKSLFEN